MTVVHKTKKTNKNYITPGMTPKVSASDSQELSYSLAFSKFACRKPLNASMCFSLEKRTWFAKFWRIWKQNTWLVFIYIVWWCLFSGALFLRWPSSEGIIRFNAPFHCSVVTEVEQRVIKVSIKWQSVNGEVNHNKKSWPLTFRKAKKRFKV